MAATRLAQVRGKRGTRARMRVRIWMTHTVWRRLLGGKGWPSQGQKAPAATKR